MKSLYAHFLIIITSIFLIHPVLSQSNKIHEQQIVSLQGDTLYLSDIVKDKKLVFRYSVLNCKPCIDSIFIYIQEEVKNIGKNNIIIFTYFTNFRHFIVSARLNQINYEIFLIPENKLAIAEDSLKVPYFFVIDENLSVNKPFVIYNIEEQKKHLHTYLSQLKEYF